MALTHVGVSYQIVLADGEIAKQDAYTWHNQREQRRAPVKHVAALEAAVETMLADVVNERGILTRWPEGTTIRPQVIEMTVG